MGKPRSINFDIKDYDYWVKEYIQKSELYGKPISNMYLRKDEFNLPDSRWYVKNCPDKPIRNSTLNEWCKKIGNMIDVPTLHPHDFRHSYATLLKNAGISLEDVSTMLNHSGTDVTKKFYIKVDTSKVRKLKDSINI